MPSEIALESRHPTGREWLANDFDYDLPPNAIAQEPLPNRSSARLLVVRPRSLEVSHDTVSNLRAWLRPGDLLVANNSRVIPARLRGTREGTGGRTELLLLRRVGDERWEALAKPARRLRPGTRIVVPANDGSGQASMGVEVEALGSDGHVTVRLDREEGVDLAVYGGVPLPPYITVPLADPERYQTVYADAEGSVAAPTAGLHFTVALIDSLRAAGIGWAEVTLHVGLDTFRPVTADRLGEHTIHREWFAVPDETATAIAETKRAGGR
ncbi:MAG TPA: S-adenosylmethionine:tRNA ribosyltransferase-isomerase, partial [Thermomicrobiales bacterium]|nr:S-adenosylmethionine:tRNA ribosyltransferase-isomerase [Thermomicrobiales bacterium]